MPVFGVISVRIFWHLDRMREIRTRITPNAYTFDEVTIFGFSRSSNILYKINQTIRTNSISLITTVTINPLVSKLTYNIYRLLKNTRNKSMFLILLLTHIYTIFLVLTQLLLYHSFPLFKSMLIMHRYHVLP